MHQKNLKLVMLYDFYAPLLTKKQQDIFEMYYNDDYSLAEVAESYDISRQGVYDLLKRTEAILENYEEKLGMVKKFSVHQDKFKQIKEIALCIESDASNCKKEIIRIVDSLIEE